MYTFDSRQPLGSFNHISIEASVRATKSVWPSAVRRRASIPCGTHSTNRQRWTSGIADVSRAGVTETILTNLLHRHKQGAAAVLAAPSGVPELKGI